MGRATKEVTDVDRREGILFLGLGALSVWGLLFLMAMWELEAVTAGALVGWISLICMGFCLGASLPSALPSLFRRGRSSSSRNPLDRRSDLMASLLVLGISGQMIFPVSEHRWDYLPSLAFSMIAVLGGYRLARH